MSYTVLTTCCCRVSLSLVLVFAALAGCSNHQGWDTAIFNGDDGDGIGGTGISGEDGIGGTGIIGIVSDVDDFTVNGRRLKIDDRTIVKIDGRLGSQTDLRRGQMVMVEASGPIASLRADQISIRYEVVGPITRVGPDPNDVVVLDQRVSIVPGARDPNSLKVGDWVAISGLRLSPGRIEATRVERRDAPSVAQLYGRYQINSKDKVQPVRVANMSVPGLPSEQALIDRDVLLRGQFEDGRLVASQIVPQNETPFERQPASVSIVAYIDQESDPPQLFGLSLVGVDDQRDDDVATDGDAGRLVVMEGRFAQEAGNVEVLQVRDLDNLLEDTPNGESESEPEFSPPPQPKGPAGKTGPASPSAQPPNSLQPGTAAQPQNLSKQARKQAEKEAKEAEKRAEKERKEREKAAKKAQKQAEKEEKEAEKQAKKERKEREKAAKKAQKQAEKEEKEAEKRAEKERKEREKKEKKSKKSKKSKKGNKGKKKT